ncbi:class I SAM-dependent methyltransferase [Glacieibacterium megasporae]|uniref:class I SAM-dependent methyltransferase n=1 Tax=Glacieibacterium megasporae TaxID=2835787 RepID=UPI001C1E63B4|nr:methyltransferase [Polymorphobacter megasporae]UAJ10200.1 methyltransferase [Polymorphobacter megasporae]
MRATTYLIAAMLLGTTAATAHPEMAVKDAHRPAADVARDADRKPVEMLEFAKVDHGKKVVDFIAGKGYFTRLFAVAVKPGGSVVAIIPKQVADRDPATVANMQSIVAEPAYGDVTMVAGLLDPAVQGADVVWTAQNYHDLHNAAPEIVAGANKAVFAALKPGGYYVIIDHTAAAGAAPDVTKTLHRIDPAVVKAEVIAAGFVLDGESKALVNPADDHTKAVFDPSIRGHTDQFALRFRKP